MKKSKLLWQSILCVLILFQGKIYSQEYEEMQYAARININQLLLDNDNPVGVISGSASVTPGGAATYQIPIFCSPGSNGMQPELSISYSSQSGYGSLGWGWDLFGTSSISRTPKTLFQDGTMASVTMSATDVYSIDGNRLYLESIANGGNRTYRSEMESFSQITSYSTGGGINGPVYFTQVLSDGTIKEYGNSSDSRKVISSTNYIGVWRLNKVTDINGNYMVYNYNSQGLLASIEYTGNEAANLDPYNQIVFVYKLRSDPNKTYPGYSASLEDNVLLTEIQIFNENSLVKKYVFRYNYSSNDVYSLLNEIIEMDGNGNQLNPTVINWNAPLINDTTQLKQNLSNKSLYTVPACQNVFFDQVKYEYNRKKFPGRGAYDEKDNYIIIEPDYAATVYGDFNGDGYMDILEAKTKDDPGPAVIDWKIFLFNVSTKNYPDNQYPDALGTIANSNSQYDLRLLQPASADLDGNGTDEIYFAFDNEAKAHFGDNCVDSIDLVCYKFGNSTLTELTNYRINNLAGRGIFGNTPGEIGYYISFLDLNGDGAENEMIFEDKSYGHQFIYNSVPVSHPNITNCNGVNLNEAEYDFISNPDLFLGGIADEKTSFIDFNGNGKTEMMRYNPAGGDTCHFYFYEYTGTAYQQIFSMQQSISNLENSVNPGDYNGDGKTDLLIFTAADEWVLLISKGDAFETISANNFLITTLNDYTTNAYDGKVVCQDYNGDGKTDVLYTYVPMGTHDNLVKIFYSTGKDFKLLDYGNFGISNIPSNTLLTFYPMGDMNGDGNADLIVNYTIMNGDACNESTTHLVFVNPEKRPLLVNTITNGFLQNISFAYKPMSDASVYTKIVHDPGEFLDYSGTSYLVSAMTQPDGIGGTSTTSYNYEGGIVHKFGKGLLGFSKVTAQNNVSLVKTESMYEPDPDFLLMNLTDAKTYINNVLTSRIQTTYETLSVYRDHTSPLNGNLPVDYYLGIFNYISHSSETNNIAGTGVEKIFTYYNSSSLEIIANKGNQITVTETYGSDGTVVTTNTFGTATYGTLSLTKLMETTVNRSIGSEQFTKSTEYTYNANGLLASVIDFSNLGTGAITTAYTYTADHIGNIGTKTISASGVPNRSTGYEYDDYGRFLTKETNLLHQQTIYAYDTKFGQKTSVTDIYGNITTYQYDGFGNLTQENLPNNYSNSYSKNWQSVTTIPHCIFYTTATLYNAPDVITYYDAMGRDLKTQSLTLGDEAIYTDKEYNAKGQLYRSCLPYKSGQTQKWTINTYNNYNQPIEINSNGIHSYIAYSGKTVTFTDADAHQKSKTVNDMGLVVTATDSGGEILYTYAGNGSPLSIKSNGSNINNDYDDYGRLVLTEDPDAGTTTTEYNTFGDIILQIDANNVKFEFTYDNYGRLITKKGSIEVYNYSYVSPTSTGGGLLNKIELDNGETISFTYNNYGQVLSETRLIDGTNYSFNYSYDLKGNKEYITYPNGFEVKRIYDDDGRMIEVDRTDLEKPIWMVDAVNELGLPTQIIQGDHLLTTDYGYDNYYYLASISNNLQDDSYVWDANNGNLSSRTNNITDNTEEFTYDNLNRLTEVKLNNVTVKEMSYADNGNINSKTDAGVYSYDPTKVHAVLNIDDNNDIGAIGHEKQNITYTPFNKVKTIGEINAGYDSIVYFYGPDMQRNRMEIYNENYGGNHPYDGVRIYDGLYEIQILDDTVRQYCYVEGGFGITAVRIIEHIVNAQAELITETSLDQEMYYLLRDHQGSITGMVDYNGSLAESYSYDAWGRRRNPEDWSYHHVPQPRLMFRGYTMHEMLDNFALINMNGRCYDPVVGRFLSPDILIQDGNSTQSYNRYSYCINNPLKYNDPSGWSWNPLQAARHAEEVAMGMQLRLFSHPFTASIIRSGGTSSFFYGGNSIASQTDWANYHMDMGDIARILHNVLGGAGLFGNPDENATPYNEPSDAPCDPYREENVLSNADLGVAGLTISAKAYNTTGDCEGGWPGLDIDITYQCVDNCGGYYFKQNKQRDDEPQKPDARYDSDKLSVGDVKSQQINFYDRPSFSSEADAFGTIEHHWTGETTLYNNNNEKVFTLYWGFNVCNYGIGPNGYTHICNVEPYNFVIKKY